MTPKQCRELAEYHSHMEGWCRAESAQCAELVAVSWVDAAIRHQESARYWREKADG